MGTWNPCLALTRALGRVEIVAVRVRRLSCKGSISEVCGNIPGDRQWLLPGEGAIVHLILYWVTPNVRTVLEHRALFTSSALSTADLSVMIAARLMTQFPGSLSTHKEGFLLDGLSQLPNDTLFYL